MDKYSFQYCQKIIVLSKDGSEVLLCKRQGEAEFDGVYSFIGGKMESSDKTIVDGVKREKDEEVGIGFRIRLLPSYTINVLYMKKDGNPMILPHYLAYHIDGEVELNEEYSDYKWIKLNELMSFEPKIPRIPEMIHEIRRLESITTDDDFIEI